MGFEFQWPWMAVLLLAPVLVRLFWPAAELRKGKTPPRPVIQQRTLLHPAIEQLSDNFKTQTHDATTKSPLHGWLLLLLWALLVLALMRPQVIEQHTQTRNEGYDLMLAIDASHSMEALDFTVRGRPVTRMAVLKGVVDQFITARKNDRVGLIVFGSKAYTISPLSHDLQTVRYQLNDIQPNIAGQGTALGDAIGLGVLRLRERPEGGRVLILVADGGNTSGTIPPLEAARMAAAARIRVYAIGVGSAKKSIPIMEQGKLAMRDDLLIDEALLRNVARLSHGAYFRATDPNALAEIYSRIGQLEKTLASSRTVLIPHSMHHWPLGGALLVALLLGLFPDGRIRLPGAPAFDLTQRIKNRTTARRRAPERAS